MGDVTLPGAGAVVATDVVDGVNFQLIKLDFGAPGASAPVTGGIKTSAASLSVAPSSDGVFTVAFGPAALTDISGTVTAGGTAQHATAANAARKGFWFQNTSNGPLWINTLADAVLASPSMQIPAGAYYEAPQGGAGTGVLSVIGATTGQTWSARQW